MRIIGIVHLTMSLYIIFIKKCTRVHRQLIFVLGIEHRASHMIITFLNHFYRLLKLQINFKRFCLFKLLLGNFLYISSNPVTYVYNDALRLRTAG